MTYRGIKTILHGHLTFDGAGVRIHRVFGNAEVKLFDPFLLLDEFGSEEPREYLPGFPTHPHRGIETVTYMLEGSVAHKDSIGNSGTIGPGDLQWMTAGGGILHEEMPQLSPHGIRGLQLWVNLPRLGKMSQPEYRGAGSNEVPLVKFPGGEVRVFSGKFGSNEGVFKDISGNPTYFDVHLNSNATAEFEAPLGETSFAYVYEGSLDGEAAGKALDGLFFHDAGTCLLFGDGEAISVHSGPAGCSFVYARGRPLREPIAWGGPIVMNTREELEEAFHELERGTFIRKNART